MLNYNIKGTGLEITDELRSYVERRLAHADKFLQGDPSALVAVELEHQAARSGERNRAEFTVSAAGAVYRAERWAETMHAAIDIAVGELSNELGRGKKKRIHLVRRSAHAVKEYLRGWRTR
ncbi:ribosome-associated translation inhibitor RaiA [Candidatus Kaiserbacteria bacterium]|nr:ribosome-associated translation inhibitor RaiA [Candidatus Kaiserbacteria bacterium]